MTQFLRHKNEPASHVMASPVASAAADRAEDWVARSEEIEASESDRVVSAPANEVTDDPTDEN